MADTIQSTVELTLAMRASGSRTGAFRNGATMMVVHSFHNREYCNSRLVEDRVEDLGEELMLSSVRGVVSSCWWVKFVWLNSAW